MHDKTTWHGFIPEKIKELHKAGHSRGTIDAACLSLDISGFTSMSSALNKLGKQGAETISSVLNACFDIIIGEVTVQGGTVCFFAGDAIMAVFSGKDKSSRAMTAARRIGSFFSKHGNMDTALGNYAIAVRLGISEGLVSWNILGDNRDKTCCFGGEAFAKAVEAQQGADKNCCYCANTDMMLSPDTETNAKFSHVAIEAKEGEFRAVYSIFCRFGDSCCIAIDDETTNTILKLCVEYGAYFNGYDCTDKGNTFLVFFGAPYSIEHIEKHIASFISELFDRYGKEISIAVELGCLFTGKIGSSDVSTYTCIGEAINLSAHICLKAENGQVLFGETAAGSLQDHIVLGKPFSVAIKKGTVTVRSRMEAGHQAENREALIGLEKEKAVILGCLGKLRERNSGSRLYLWGKAGMGKSSLVSMLENACKSAGITCWSMSSDNIIQESLLPVRKFLRGTFDCASFDRFLESYNKLILDHAHKQPDDEISSELQRAALFFRHIIGERDSQEEPELLDRGDMLLTIQLALRSLIKNLAALNPLVLIFEDLQWMDKDTRHFIELLHRDWGKLPVFLVVTARNEKHLLAKTRRMYQDGDILHMHLKPHTKKTTGTMISSILGGNAGKSVNDYVFSKSRGVPFFTEQYTQYLVVHDFLKKEKDLFELNSVPESLPVSVTSVITAIIDKLEPQLRRSVNVASVLGSDFYSGICANLAAKFNQNRNDNQKSGDFEQSLVEGEYLRIWKKKSKEIYSFLNRLVRDVAYNIQLSGILAQLHVTAAELIEQEVKDNPDFYAEAVYHYEQGKRKDDAARCAELAASHFADFSLEDAEKYAERYLNNVMIASGENAPETVKPAVFLSDILNQRGKYQKSVQNLKQALAIIKKTGNSGSKEHLKALINLGEDRKSVV